MRTPILIFLLCACWVLNGMAQHTQIDNAENTVTLQINQGKNDATASVVEINNAGAQPALDISNTNSTSMTPAAKIRNAGQLDGLFVKNTNTTNTSPAVHGEATGTAPGVQGINLMNGPAIRGIKELTQTSHAGLFVNTNATNVVATLQANSNSAGFAVLGENSSTGASIAGSKSGAATGHAGLFNNTNPLNPDPTLYVASNGANAALESNNTSTGPSIRGIKMAMATGPAGEFTNLNGMNVAPALVASSIGTSPALEAFQTGSVPSVIATKAGFATGSCVFLENANILNLDPVLHIRDVNVDLGLALLAEGNARITHNLFSMNVDVVNNDYSRPAAVVKNYNSGASALFIDQSADSLLSIGAAVVIQQNALGSGLESAILRGTNDADAVVGSTVGFGSAGSFLVSNPLSESAALFASHDGSGPGLSAENLDDGHAISATKSGSSGHAGLFHTTTAGNPDATVKIIHADPAAAALDVDGNVFFSGDLTADDILAATITAGAKAFRIDHPLDPKNKYLKHISIETDEMMNLYTGNVILDKKGKAVVQLPEWFEALNCDFRYHLTCVGKHGRVYISKEINNGEFEIAGGKKGMKVSWQITGTRHDQFAKNNPLEVEQWK